MVLVNLAANLLLALAFGQSQQHIPVPTPDNRYRPEPAVQQDQDQVYSMPLPKFDQGMVTRYSANAIPPNALSEALNVVVDQDIDGVIVRRNGYAKYNATALEDAKSIRGSWTFDATDGTKYIVVNTSTSFFQSAGDGSYTQIPGPTNTSAAKEYDCVQTLGKLWCNNDTTSFYWDGTSTKSLSLPAGGLVDTFRNRLLVADITGSLSRLQMSGELDGEDFILGTKSTSPANIDIGGSNDGENITCLMGAYQDVFLIGKKKAIYGLYGFDRNDFVVRELSREVGCIDDRSVQEKNNCLYWLSQRGVERFCGATITRVSDPIRDQIDEIIESAGNSRNIIDTTQSDFEAGNLEPEPGIVNSASVTPGSVRPSTYTRTVDTAAQFNNGTNVLTSTSAPSGSVVLALTTAAATFNNFANESLTQNPKWTKNGNDLWGFGNPVMPAFLCFCHQ